MANKVFDKETLLDLIVNGVPLFILLFFIGIFAVLPYFGSSGLATGLQYAIVALSFVALGVLTYLAAVAIAGSEIGNDVYLPGQASVEGAKPIEEREQERIWELEGQEKPAEGKALGEGESVEESDEEATEADEETDDEAAEAAEGSEESEGSSEETEAEEAADGDADEEQSQS
jgi:hypothetical protein